MQIVRSAEMDWQGRVAHGAFEQRRKELGGTRANCGLWELPPGKKSFPLHRHHGTEEAMFVLSGKAKLRTTEGETALGPGDFVSFPAGDVAHQLINDGAEPVVYLAIGVSLGVDVVEYPATGNIARAMGAPPSGKRFVFRSDQQADYWEGER